MRFLLTCAALIGLNHGATAQLSGDPMSEREIKEFLSGNTIAAEDWGVTSFEYHSPDGEALWINDGVLSVGEYRVKGSEVCYIYEDSIDQGWFCWNFQRDVRTDEVTMWTEYGSSYIIYVHAEGDIVSDMETREPDPVDAEGDLSQMLEDLLEDAETN